MSQDIKQKTKDFSCWLLVDLSSDLQAWLVANAESKQMLAGRKIWE